MAKGANAKIEVKNIIEAAFQENYIGEFDGKLYVWADDGGDRVQISIALTCPKVMRGIEETGPAVLNFDDDPPQVAPGFKPAEVTPEETARLEDLMKKLGL